VNGATHTLALDPRRTLLDVLREDLQLTGAKQVCDMGNCGACTVLVDGQAVYACLVLALECADAEITTIEGLGQPGTLDPIQRAFIEADAFQCGFCTPGQVMALKGLLGHDPHPDDAALARALSGNLCRCGAYRNLMRAARIAAGREPDPTGTCDGPD
jgi:aerobic-type carbon monoxide dehydrogenase small subunit (CoxS/CutS family)